MRTFQNFQKYGFTQSLHKRASQTFILRIPSDTCCVFWPSNGCFACHSLLKSFFCCFIYIDHEVSNTDLLLGYRFPPKNSRRHNRIYNIYWLLTWFKFVQLLTFYCSEDNWTLGYQVKSSRSWSFIWELFGTPGLQPNSTLTGCLWAQARASSNLYFFVRPGT